MQPAAYLRADHAASCSPSALGRLPLFAGLALERLLRAHDVPDEASKLHGALAAFDPPAGIARAHRRSGGRAFQRAPDDGSVLPGGAAAALLVHADAKVLRGIDREDRSGRLIAGIRSKVAARCARIEPRFFMRQTFASR